MEKALDLKNFDKSVNPSDNFNEYVNGFDSSDVDVEGGTLSSFNGSGTEYNFIVTPTKSGTVTVGNSCPITDGASAMLLASEEAVKKYLKPNLE